MKEKNVQNRAESFSRLALISLIISNILFIASLYVLTTQCLQVSLDLPTLFGEKPVRPGWSIRHQRRNGRNNNSFYTTLAAFI